MEGDRDPWLCGRCEIVNPWLNETCRQCGENRQDVESSRESHDFPGQTEGDSSDEQEQREPQVEREPPLLPEKPRRLNGLAMVIGAIVLLGANWLGTGLVMSWAMEASPEFAHIAEQFEKAPAGDYEPSEEQKESVSGVVKVLAGYLAFAVLVLPFLIGLVLGRITGGLAEAAWAMGLGATFQYLTEISGLLIALVVVVMVAMSVGSGVLGAVLGTKWRRNKRIASMPRG